MFRRVRKKLACAISEITSEEDFLYNTWLKVVPTNGVPIGRITSSLIDTPQIDFSLDELPSPDELEIFEPFSLLNKSTLYPEESTHLFKKISTNPIFFALLYVPSRIINHKDIEFVVPATHLQEIAVKFKLPKPAGYKFRFTEPEIKDYLSNLHTKVEKIELLNFEDLFVDYNITAIRSLNVKSFGKLKIKKLKVDRIRKVPKLHNVNVPEMGEYKSKISQIQLLAIGGTKISKTINLIINKPSIASGKYEISSPQSAKYYDVSDPDLINIPAKKINSLQDPNKTKDVIKLLLKNTIKVDWEKRKDTNISLTNFEEVNSKFLVENDRALLCKELGLGGTKEALIALKFLFMNKIIHSSLIIVPKEMIGIEGDEKHLDAGLNWIGNMRKFCPELSHSVIKGKDDERLDAWNNSALIYLTDYSTFVKDFHMKILESSRLTRFDCIVMDEVQNVLDENKERAEFLNKINPKVLWTLSSVVDDGLLDNINKRLSKDVFIEKQKVQKFSEVLDEQSGILYKEFWLEPDEHQKVEYKETISSCRKDLRKVLESENPFRFQSNIFTLLHKLYQVENFAKGADTSPKTNLLLKHLNIIKRNGKKVIIISQYDRQGTKKIEKLLENSDIDHVSAPASLSADEMQKAIKLFKENDSITVFVTNAKEVRLNFGNFVVPYIIKYDSWWNPTTIWQLEDLFKIDEKELQKSRINVFSYKMFNTIDVDIKNILTKKQLFDKNIVSVIPVSTMNELISVEEWLVIFGMVIENSEQKKHITYNETLKKLQSLSVADFKTTLSKFFFSIGYPKPEILADLNSVSFDISGEGKAGSKSVHLFARVLLEDSVSADKVKEIITAASQIRKRNIFIITRGKFEDGCEKHVNENVTLISVEELAMYLVNLNLVPQGQSEISVKDNEIPWRED
jgi:Helicase conserved C-terminal domain